MSDEKTLRDEFAMAVITGCLYSPEDEPQLPEQARMAWKLADAMLAERQKTGRPTGPDPIKAMHERAYPLAGPFAPPFEAEGRLSRLEQWRGQLVEALQRFGLKERDAIISWLEGHLGELDALKTENAKLKQENADQSASIAYAKLALTDLRGAVKSQPKSS